MNESNTSKITAIHEAEQAGIDLSLIDENLRWSYEQRALQHQAALNLALELEKKDSSFAIKSVECSMKRVGQQPLYTQCLK